MRLSVGIFRVNTVWFDELGSSCGCYFSLVVRKPDFVACEQQKSAFMNVSAQSDHHIWFLPYEKYNGKTCKMQNFNLRASMCGIAVWLQPYQVEIPKAGYCPDMTETLLTGR